MIARALDMDKIAAFGHTGCVVDREMRAIVQPSRCILDNRRRAIYQIPRAKNAHFVDANTIADRVVIAQEGKFPRRSSNPAGSSPN